MYLCLDCKHSSRDPKDGDLICKFVPPDFDQGVREGWARCDALRHSRHPAACGQMGKFFELKDTE